jgi:hypothetical protein
MPLRPEKPGDEVLIGELVLVGVSQLGVEDFGDASEVKRLEALGDLIRHRDPPG